MGHYIGEENQRGAMMDGIGMLGGFMIATELRLLASKETCLCQDSNCLAEIGFKTKLGLGKFL